MAIYHASIKSFSRGKGQSSVAAAAYRAGIDLVDTRARVEHRYAKRKGVESFHMLAPEGAPEWCRDARAFWDANENGETRANSRLARELEVSLPNELDAAAREALAFALGQELVNRVQAVVLVAIHAPSSEGDNRNHHVHLLMSARQMGPGGFGARAASEFDARNGKGADAVREVREWVGVIINEHLAKAGQQHRVDHRSLRDQALAAAAGGDIEGARLLSRPPTKHIGKVETWQARKSERNLSIFGLEPTDPFEAAVAQAAAEGRLVATPEGHHHGQALADRAGGASGAAFPELTRSEIRRKSWPRMTNEPSPVAQRLMRVIRLARAQGKDADLLNSQAEVVEGWLETQREVARHALEALQVIPGVQVEPEFTAATEVLSVRRVDTHGRLGGLYEDTEALSRAIRDYAVAMREPHDARVALRRAIARLSEAEGASGRLRDAQVRSARRRLDRAKKAASPRVAASQAKKISEARAAMIGATQHLSDTYFILRAGDWTLAEVEPCAKMGEDATAMRLRPRMGPHLH